MVVNGPTNTSPIPASDIAFTSVDISCIKILESYSLSNPSSKKTRFPYFSDVASDNSLTVFTNCKLPYSSDLSAIIPSCFTLITC